MDDHPAVRCFISSPAGVNTGVLRAALEAVNVEWFDVASVEPGTSLLETIGAAIGRSDFVCAVISAPSPRDRPNVMFELGLAVGAGKRVLIFIEPEADLPIDVSTLNVVRARLDDYQAMIFNLNAFLHRFPPRSKGRPTKPPKVIEEAQVTWARNEAVELERTRPDISSRELEALVARLFEGMGAVVNHEWRGPDLGVDMAIWIDGIQSFLGSPILVELKTGRFTEDRLSEVEEEVRRFLSKTHLEAGLVIYLDRRGARFARLRQMFPLVFRFDAIDLFKIVAEGNFIRTLLSERNVVIHGRG